MGYKESEVLGRKLSDFSPEAMRPDIESAVERVWTGEQRSLEIIQIRSEQPSIIWNAILNPVVDRVGNITGFIGIFSDITDRKRAEETLRESEERFKLAMEANRDGLWDWNLTTNEVYYSPGYAAMLGYTSSEVPAHVSSWLDLMHPADKESAFKANVDCIENRCDVFAVEFRMKAKSGEWRWILGCGKAVIRDSSGRATRMVGTHTDITDRKRAEATLIQNDRLLQRAEDIARFGNWELLLDEQVVYASDGAKSIYGFEGKEWQLSDVQKIVISEYRSVLDMALKDLVAHGIPYNVEFKIRRPKDGNIIDIHSIAEYDAEKNLVFGVIQDITERLRAENEKNALQLQLLESQKMESVARLAGGVAHDFNNMLSAILGHAELAMTRCTPSDSIYANLKAINKSALRSAELVRQLLAFACRQPVAPMLLDLNTRVTTMIEMLQRLIGEDIELVRMAKADLWPVKIDPSQIDQILANLCVNARDAIPGVGKITVETENTSFDEVYCASNPGFICGEYVMLAVSDDGHGMSKEVLDHIFEPFFTTKEVGKGTGLGLATVHGIVKQNEGFINVYSSLGKGSTFRIYLPRCTGVAIATMAAKVAEIPQGSGETVLLVEDEAVILKVGKAMLESLGYKVVTASTPSEALRKVQAHVAEIHLLVTDVIMPEMNGRDLAKLIDDIKPGLKCLFTSGYTADVIAHHGVLDEGLYFLPKPFSMKDLASKVRALLNQTR